MSECILEMPHERPVLDCSDSPSQVRPEFARDADINFIVHKFLVDGVVPQPNLGREMIDGLDAPGDFSEACEMAFYSLNNGGTTNEISSDSEHTESNNDDAGQGNESNEGRGQAESQSSSRSNL